MNCGTDRNTFVQYYGHMNQKNRNVFKLLNMSDMKVLSFMLLNMVGDEAIRVTEGQDCVIPNVWHVQLI
jgi:hypothetical protein